MPELIFIDSPHITLKTILTRLRNRWYHSNITYIIYLYLHFFTHENLTYLEYDDWGSSRKNKYICLLTSPLFHALQHEIINLIYLFIYIYIYHII